MLCCFPELSWLTRSFALPLARVGLPAVYYSSDTVKEDETLDRQPTAELLEYLALTSEHGIPPHELTLKPDCLCSVMRNLSIEDGLVKNARVIVRRLSRHTIEVETLPNASNSFASATFSLPRINFEFQPSYCPWTVQRKQFPLRLAYATTFNSCQGLTLDRAVIDMRVPVFAHGQLYTAFSRVRRRRDVRCFFDANAAVGDEDERRKVRNVVYRELLL
jgi:hypothetical protein